MFQPALRLGAGLTPPQGPCLSSKELKAGTPGHLGLPSHYLPSSVGRGQGSSTPRDAQAAPTTKLQRRAPLGSTPASQIGAMRPQNRLGAAVATPLAPCTSSRLRGALSQGAGEEPCPEGGCAREASPGPRAHARLRGASAHGHVLLPGPGRSVAAV